MLAHKLGSLRCLSPSQAIPKLQTHNLICKTMHISKRPRRPNLVCGPKSGGNSIFHPSLGPLESDAYFPRGNHSLRALVLTGGLTLSHSLFLFNSPMTLVLLGTIPYLSKETFQNTLSDLLRDIFSLVQGNLSRYSL